MDPQNELPDIRFLLELIDPAVALLRRRAGGGEARLSRYRGQDAAPQRAASVASWLAQRQALRLKQRRSAARQLR